MANQSEPNTEEISRENRYMWIAVGIIVVILAGGMGINMLVHKDTVAAPAETTTTTTTPQQ
jgi:hypothetical protein